MKVPEHGDALSPAVSAASPGFVQEAGPIVTTLKWPEQLAARLRFVFVALFATGLVGCSAFLPAHTHSNKRDEQPISVEMITWEEATQPEFNQDYQAVFHRSVPKPVPAIPQEKVVPAIAAAAAAALVGLAVDYVQNELKKEASLYEAQFGQTIFGDDYYREIEVTNPPSGSVHTTKEVMTERHTVQRELAQGTWKTNETYVNERIFSAEEDKLWQSLRPNYYGFKVRRDLKGKKGDTNAFLLICGIAPSADGQMWRIAPLRFKTEYGKAKVLSDQAGWWLLPTTWFRWLFGSSGHEIDTEVNVEVDAYWRGKDQTANVTKAAGFDMKFPAYDLDKRLVLHQSASPTNPPAGEGKLTTGPSGWLLGLPVSYDVYGAPVGRGTYSLKVLVTERDKSNAKKYLEEGAKLVGENKSKITGAVSNSLKP